MSARESYFRFPLAALSYGPPLDTLDALISYGVIHAGQGARKSLGEKDFPSFAEVAIPEKKLGPVPLRGTERDLLYEVALGAQMCGVGVQDWRLTREKAEKVSLHVARWMEQHADSRSFVTIKAAWLWQTLDTLLVESGQPPRNVRFDMGTRRISWREFAILCAILSCVGDKPYAYISSSDVAHRACGFTRAAAFKSAERLPEFLPELTRKQIDRTLRDLEANKFFLRCRISSGPTGGRTAYSFREMDREVLITELVRRLERRDRKIVDQNRERDRQLFTSKYAGTLDFAGKVQVRDKPGGSAGQA